MNETRGGFGRGLIKVLVSLLVGGGVGFLTFGVTAMINPSIWNRREPPGELFLSIGGGLLTSGVLLLILFLFPRRRTTPPPAEECWQAPAREDAASTRIKSERPF
jgi:hypothetical protein